MGEWLGKGIAIVIRMCKKMFSIDRSSSLFFHALGWNPRTTWTLSEVAHKNYPPYAPRWSECSSVPHSQVLVPRFSHFTRLERERNSDLDTLTERDSLIENIFPKLKDYCREKYGLEFQVCSSTPVFNKHHPVRSSLSWQVCGHAMGHSNRISEQSRGSRDVSQRNRIVQEILRSNEFRGLFPWEKPWKISRDLLLTRLGFTWQSLWVTTDPRRDPGDPIRTTEICRCQRTEWKQRERVVDSMVSIRHEFPPDDIRSAKHLFDSTGIHLESEFVSLVEWQKDRSNECSS